MKIYSNQEKSYYMQWFQETIDKPFTSASSNKRKKITKSRMLWNDKFKEIGCVCKLSRKEHSIGIWLNCREGQRIICSWFKKKKNVEFFKKSLQELYKFAFQRVLSANSIIMLK